MKIFMISLALLSVSAANAMQGERITLHEFKALPAEKQATQFKNLSEEDRIQWLAPIAKDMLETRGKKINLKDIIDVMEGYLERKKEGKPDAKDRDAREFTRYLQSSNPLVERALIEEYKSR
jgi:hypothetical protein